MVTLPLSHIESYLMVDGKKYEIEEFNIKFNQPVDHRGQPQYEERGGQFIIGLTQMADTNLYTWAKDSTALKDGVVVFDTQMSGAVLRVKFFNAYCFTLDTEIKQESGIITRLFISPERVIINDIEHDNFWSRKK